MWPSGLVLTRNGALIFMARPLLFEFEHCGLEINPHGRKLRKMSCPRKPSTCVLIRLLALRRVHHHHTPVHPMALGKPQVDLAHHVIALCACSCIGGLQGSELDGGKTNGLRAEDCIVCAGVEK